MSLLNTFMYVNISLHLFWQHLSIVVNLWIHSKTTINPHASHNSQSRHTTTPFTTTPRGASSMTISWSVGRSCDCIWLPFHTTRRHYGLHIFVSLTLPHRQTTNICWTPWLSGRWNWVTAEIMHASWFDVPYQHQVSNNSSEILKTKLTTRVYRSVVRCYLNKRMVICLNHAKQGYRKAYIWRCWWSIDLRRDMSSERLWFECIYVFGNCTICIGRVRPDWLCGTTTRIILIQIARFRVPLRR